MKRLAFILLFIILSGIVIVPARAETSYYAVSFTGSGQVSTGTTMSFTDGATVIILFKTTSTGRQALVDARTDTYVNGGAGFNLFIEDGKVLAGVGNGTAYVSALSVAAEDVYSTGEILMLTTRFDLSTATIDVFKNGQLAGYLPNVDVSGPITTGSIVLANSPHGADEYPFSGTIYLVLVYNRLLSDEEVQAIYSDPLNPPTNGLVLFYAPDSVDTANNIWKDKSGNGNDGTISGASYKPLTTPPESFDYILSFNGTSYLHPCFIQPDPYCEDCALFVPLEDLVDNGDGTGSTTVYVNGQAQVAMVYFNSTTGYPKLVAGKDGNALEFDGNAPEGIIVENVTAGEIDVWFKWDGTTAGSWPWNPIVLIVNKTNSNHKMFLYVYDPNYFAVFAGDRSGNAKVLVHEIEANNWYLARVYVDGTVKVQLYDENGTLLWSGDTGIVESYQNLRFYIGRYMYGNGFNGIIDEVRIYPTMRQDDELKLLLHLGRYKLTGTLPVNLTAIYLENNTWYNQTFHPNETAYWQFFKPGFTGKLAMMSADNMLLANATLYEIIPGLDLVDECGEIYNATLEQVNTPSLTVYDAQDGSAIPLENVSLTLIANNTTTSLLSGLPILPFNDTVTLNVSATGHYPRLITTWTGVNSLAVYLEPVNESASEPEVSGFNSTISAPEEFSSFDPNFIDFESDVESIFTGRYGMLVAALMVIGLVVASLKFHQNPMTSATVLGVAVVYIGTWAYVNWGWLFTLVMMLISAGIMRTFGRWREA